MKEIGKDFIDSLDTFERLIENEDVIILNTQGLALFEVFKEPFDEEYSFITDELSNVTYVEFVYYDKDIDSNINAVLVRKGEEFNYKYIVTDAETGNAEIGTFDNIEDAIQCADENREDGLEFDIHDQNGKRYYHSLYGYID